MNSLIIIVKIVKRTSRKVLLPIRFILRLQIEKSCYNVKENIIKLKGKPNSHIQTRKSVDGEPSHIPALIKANRIEASYFLAYVAKYG